MADKDFDPYALSSGLVDGYEGTIKDAFFGYDSEYQNGEACILRLEILTDNEELEDNTDNPLYPCGKGWEPKGKGGAEVQHESGKPKNFNRQSGIGLLIGAALEAGAPLREIGLPTQAATWKGLRFQWERKEFSANIGGEKSTWARMLPVKYLGDGQEAKGKAKATEAKAEADDGEGTMAALSKPMMAKLKNLAKQCENHDQFIEQAYGIDGVDGDEAVEAAVADDGPGSVWASVH